MEPKDILIAIKGPIDKALSYLGTELQQSFSSRILEYQVEEYRRNFYSKNLLHRIEPKPLKQFYQPLYISEKNGSKKKIDTNSAQTLFNTNNYITLIGSAGSGKSTIVKHLFIKSFEENYKISIKIELRYLNEYKGNFNDYIFDKIFKFQKLGFSNTIIERLLSANLFIFFLDGYDEISSGSKAEATDDIDKFVQKYPRNKYLITSRPYANIDLLPSFKNFQVCDLEEGEIASFIMKQLPSEEVELATKIINTVYNTKYKSYSSFLSNPLLLSMFILTFQSYAGIPHKRSEFYEQVFDTLFSHHDSISKLSFVRERTTGLQKDQFEEVLRVFSFLSFFADKFLFSQNYINEKLDLIKSKKPHLNFNNSKFLDDVQVAIGIINRDGLDYTFPHRSLQEYFAVAYIRNLHLDAKKTIYDKFKIDALKNARYLTNRDNFFMLLYEVDYSCLVRFVVIPALIDIHSNLMKEVKIDYKIAYKYYGQIVMIIHYLLTDKYDIILYDFFTEKPYSSYGDEYELPDHMSIDEFTERHNIDDMVNKILKFKEQGQSLVNILINDINKLDKSDQEIIDLI